MTLRLPYTDAIHALAIRHALTECSSVYVQSVLGGSTTDVTVPLRELQAYINIVAGAIRRSAPSSAPPITLSASLKLRVNSRWNERNGLRGIGLWFEDDALQAAGGDPLGTLDVRQFQYCTLREDDSEQTPKALKEVVTPPSC